MLRLPVFALVLTLLLAAPAGAEKRALAIGIDAYENVTQLQKAAGDALAMAEAFKAAGYQVIPLENVSRETFWRNWYKFLEHVKKDDETALFFSGHGLQIGAEHYLLMRDAPKAESGEGIVRQQAIQFSALLEELQSRHPRISLAILDACRNNPYAPAGHKGIGGAKGLVPVNNAPEGTFIMYSAGANEAALDRLSDADREPVSVYMRNLLPLLKTPGLRIHEVARAVRDRVYATAEKVQHRQNPAYYDGFRGEFCFAGCARSEASVVTTIIQGKRPEQTSKPKAAQSPTKPVVDACAADDPPISCLWKNSK